MGNKLQIRDHLEAGKEVPTAVLFALLPILLGLGLAAVLRSSTGTTAYLANFLASGDALLISSGLVGPLIYAITRKYGNLPQSLTIKFPHGWFFIVSILLICIFAGTIFGAQRALSQTVASETDKYSEFFDRGVMQIVSLAIILLSFTVLYFATAYRNWADREGNAPSVMRSDQQDFLEKFEAAQ